MRVAVAILATVTALASSAEQSAETYRERALSSLASAFEQLYVSNQVRIARVVVTSRGGEELRYVVHLASKRISDRHHSYGVFTAPDRLRNLTILSIEAQDRSDDHFLYLPASRRVRRISSAQRNDTFMGTDLTYEDFERRRADDYRISATTRGAVGEESTFRIEAAPRYDSGVARVVFEVATSDSAMLRISSYKRDSANPFRVLEVPRKAMVDIDSMSLPGRFVIDNFARRTRTVVDFDRISIVDSLSSSLFSSANLEVRRSIPGL